MRPALSVPVAQKKTGETHLACIPPVYSSWAALIRSVDDPNHLEPKETAWDGNRNPVAGLQKC